MSIIINDIKNDILELNSLKHIAPKYVLEEKCKMIDNKFIQNGLDPHKTTLNDYYS